jgi:hypothetical protein
MDVERIKKYFPQGFSVVIPYGREVNRALNMGVPILAFAPGTNVSAALESSLSEAFDGPETGEADGGRRHRRHFLGRRRKASA